MTTGSVTPATCGSCHYFEPRSEDRSRGRCQRFPPVAAVGVAALWPSLQDSDWCGEHPDRRADVPVRVSIDPPPALDLVDWSTCPSCGVYPADLHKPDCPSLVPGAVTPINPPLSRRALKRLRAQG